MATQKEIKQKIVSTSSIHKITQAMQMVATARSQKALRELQDFKSYYLKLQTIMATIHSVLEEKKEYKGNYWIVIMSDLGLAGGYNSMMIKTMKESLKSEEKLFIIGQKGKYLEPENTVNLDEFFKTQDKSFDKINEIIDECFENDLKLKVIYTEYISQLDYKPKVLCLIPTELDEKQKEEIKISKTMEFEPSPDELVAEIMPIYIEGMLQGIYKETQVSEHTSRRVAMENANKNSEEMLRDLNIKYNRTRQAKITQELSEIIGGAEAQK